MESSKKMQETNQEEARLKGISHEKESADDSELSQQLDACKSSLQEWQEKYMRLSADLENFKRRMEKEQQLWREMAQADLLIPLLGIVDNFDRAMEHKDKSLAAAGSSIPEELNSWVDGVAMIHGSLADFLVNAGVKEVFYDTFDPSFHDALMQVDSDAHASGAIVDVMEKGYLLNERVLRPAKVSVAK